MKRLGLICKLLSATLFLAFSTAGASRLGAQDVLSALPPKPVTPPPPDIVVTPDIVLPKPSESPAKADLPAPSKPAAPSAEAFRGRMMEMFDKNKDGRLDDEERAAARKYAEEHHLRPDGPMRDKQAKRAPAEAMRDELHRRFDRNHNGKIDDDEMPAVEQAVRTRFAAAPGLRQRLDRNNDGKIDDEEWTAARPQFQQWLNEAAEAKAPTKRAAK